MKNRAFFVLLLLMFIAPLVGQTANGSDVRLALLEQGQRQQDAHMEYQDKVLDQLREQIAEIRNEQAQIRGFGLGIGALLGIAQLIQVLLQLRIKRGS